ncbi:methylenetetrahydrofolate reductase [NAD(P)H] [Halorhodospira abdelmalekii]|uniref:methylenetetrahydrofolate reductase [NAD(P)H] n=1 Tax=Halorhodospira abdelmalekii TaxID=421629 RepID=UPI001908159B|nr:methylenetetrahydrofolate reductase [NAD(P)H] [Halorhodospira abdelmalekii]MBK1735020.1 methylenetetrahydrofolate reductase [NAD(P)H] [Halorhodospira abdelmalekii]
MESQKQHPRVFSFEFFPPKTDQGAESLRATRQRLERLNPAYFSVTFGAGGSTQDRTYETVIDIQQQSCAEAAPHISCIDSTRERLEKMILSYRDQGVKYIVALRGDRPSGSGSSGEGDFRYANELVALIRELTGDHFTIEVGAYPEFHPEAPDAFTDIENFVRKVNAGADSAITQFFYNAEAYYRFVDECEKRGVTIPIIPGIMPLMNYEQQARFAEACKADIPRWLAKRMEAMKEDPQGRLEYGIDVISELCQELLEAGAPGIHFYSLNKAPIVERIWHNLGLSQETGGEVRRPEEIELSV